MPLNVLDFGVRGNIDKSATTAIQAAVDQCHEAGGGTVLLPAGRYSSGTIRLRSQVRLELESGAVLVASQDPVDYQPLRQGAGDLQQEQGHALLVAEDAHTVAITGSGVIDGGGNEGLRHPRAAEVFRPAMLCFEGCRNVRIEGVTFLHPSQWTLHLLCCQDVLVRGVTILAHMERINTDGIDPDGCRNVIISDCVIRTGDDSIVIKDTRNNGCRNIVVSNCVLSSACAALKIGTEATGDIRNVTFSNCVIENTNVALALYQKDGSTYENILFSSMIIESYAQFPILIDIKPRDYRNPTCGRIRTVSFDHITVRSPGRVLVEGLPDHPVENVRFHNLTWTVTGSLVTTDIRKPAGARRSIADPDRENFAACAAQFVFAFVHGISLRDIRLYTEEQPMDRGLFHLRNVREARFTDIDAPDIPCDKPRITADPASQWNITAQESTNSE